MSKINLQSYTVYQLINSTAQAHPDAIAQMYRPAPGKPYANITFGEMYANVQAIALGLLELGLQQTEKVGLIADVGYRWNWACMAIDCIGGVDVPRGTDATEQDLLYIFSHTECRIIFLEHATIYKKLQQHLDKLKELKYIIFFDDPGELSMPAGIETISLQKLIENGEAKKKTDPDLFHKKASAIVEDDLCTIIYTSGTTGSPKGVMHTQKSYVWEIVHAVEGIKVKPFGVTMGFLPPWHVAERLVEAIAMRTLTAVAFTSIPTLAKDLQEARPTFLLSVPRVWESFYNRVLENVKKGSPIARGIFNFSRAVALTFSLQKDILLGRKYRLDPTNIIVLFAEKVWALIALIFLFPFYIFARLILAKVSRALGGRLGFAISGAGALPEYIDRFFYALGVPIVETYGLTENMGVTCRRSLPGLVVGTIGRPFPGAEIKLLDEKGNLITQPNIKGVAYHRGPHIMKGYYKEVEKTRAVLSEDGWLNSGDIMVYTVSGDLKFSGRAKDTIVLFSGENVEPGPIEDILKQSDFITNVVVVGQDQKTLGALLIPDEESVRKHFKEKGAGELPSSISAWRDHQDILAFFRNEIKTLNSQKNGFKNFERVGPYYLLEQDFTVGDEITQTLKIKRNVVFDKYASEIEGMYR